jgi:hypothetical protein
MNNLIERLRDWTVDNDATSNRLLDEAADRIEALEAQLADNSERYGNEIAARIEALEAALQEFISCFSKANHGWDTPKLYRLRENVKAALAPECIHSWSAPFDGMVKCTKCGSALAPEPEK